MDRNKILLDASAQLFVRKIKQKFRPVKIIIFGSRAYGEAWVYSDYDFIIVSDAFEKVHWLERISNLVRYWDSDKSLDVLPYTVKEFEYKKEFSSVVKEAVEKGKEL